MSRPRTAISLLVWDSPRYTGNLLSNLDWATPGENWHLRILDQGSEEETRSLIKSWVPTHRDTSAELLPHNIGYGAGHNRNYIQAQALFDFDYFITINSDLVFGEPGWVDQMVDAMEAAPDAALGGPFAYRETQIDPHRRLLSPATTEQAQRGEFSFITGAVTIIRAEAAEQLGLFDEIFSPAYFEDQDMVQRYLHFGWKQIHIDIPVLHGYLGAAERVNEAKRAALDAKHGDFRTRNMTTYVNRWQRGTPPVRANIRTEWPYLFFPPKRPKPSPGNTIRSLDPQGTLHNTTNPLNAPGQEQEPR